MPTSHLAYARAVTTILVVGSALLPIPAAGFGSGFGPATSSAWWASAWSSAAHVVEHISSPPTPPLESRVSLEDVANVRVPGPPGSDVEVLAFAAKPTGGNGDGRGGAVVLVHEFFGLNPSIAAKAQGLADELGCAVVAPDTFRGEVTDFIPRAIWLALSTPQDRVNDDLDAVCKYLEDEVGWSPPDGLAVMGFCYGGGKAIRYATQRRNNAATVVFYGSPLTDVEELRKLKAPVCGVFGDRDAQFPRVLLDKFRSALDKAGVESDVRVYEGVGHAFWKDMEQIRRGDQPQTEAFQQATTFLKNFFALKQSAIPQ